MSGFSRSATTSIRLPRGSSIGFSSQYRRDQSGRVFNRIIGAREPSGRTASICTVMFGGTCSGRSATTFISLSMVRLNVTFWPRLTALAADVTGTVNNS